MSISWDGAQPAYGANVYLRWRIIKTASTAAQEDESNGNVEGGGLIIELDTWGCMKPVYFLGRPDFPSSEAPPGLI